MKCAIKLKFYSTYYWHNNIYYEIIKVFLWFFFWNRTRQHISCVSLIYYGA